MACGMGMVRPECLTNKNQNTHRDFIFQIAKLSNVKLAIIQNGHRDTIFVCKVMHHIQHTLRP